MNALKEKKNSFMARYSVMVYASLIAAALGAFLIARMDTQKRGFDRTVKNALQQTGGYDEQLIDMIHDMEAVLGERAQFGYAGNRDPMTGVTRTVAVRQPSAIVRAPGGARHAAAGSAAAAPPPRAAETADHVRLTAIIYDNARKTYTAVVMDGSRSLSVDVGDRVAGRRVTKITHEEIYMESDTERFVYNILGGNTKTPK